MIDAVPGSQCLFRCVHGGCPQFDAAFVTVIVSLEFELNIQAPTRMGADLVYRDLYNYLSDPSKWWHSNFQPMPWAIYHDRADEIQLKLTSETDSEHERMWMYDQKIMQEFSRKRNERLGTNANWTPDEFAERDCHYEPRIKILMSTY